ncbi:MAG: alpha/beta hydrolase [Actinomycetota bacterium]|nr:alpha/beta hydrolase [Actinomycetota bacterium]
MISNEAQAVKNILREAKEGGTPPTTIEEQRLGLEAVASSWPVAESVSIKDCTIASLQSIEILPATTSSDRTLLWLHGGAYSAGSIKTHQSMVSRIVAASNVKALLPEYRLAPEDPFPAAIEDALMAYKEIIAQNGGASKIIVGGDSAGGGLTLALMLKLKENNIELPSKLVLLSPWTDLTASGSSVKDRAEADPWLSSDLLTPAAAVYLGTTPPGDPMASPLFGELSNLPPTLTIVGDDEILLSDSTRLHDALVDAGVDSQLIVAEGMWHVYATFPGFKESDEAIESVASFISK